ncbi:FecR family protein [Bordetella genomosp. 4]|uniref:Histidine kinase n=1 Tax=Bordetella genomosp. 4 TaxID=463044 RepID=A0A261TKA1_9BORD|nr:FecR domain-containing protein [Bordetella genomosp. 4]OZI41810.1 histidine kinase [Bordetella genomosp. 4]OZI50066.1 histidine kinase [Bordetella genomosp. 4]
MAKLETASPALGPLAEQAAHWIVRLTDDDQAERERARLEFEAWKRADPRHAAEAAAMESLIGRLQDLRAPAAGDSRPARAALDAVQACNDRRRRAKRLSVAALLLLALCAPLALVLHIAPPTYLLADLNTSAGQWKTHTLSDGTRITLDSASAVNFHYDSRRRAIELVQGNVLVSVAKDASRPFVVSTAHGCVRALGTRFVVERDDDVTVLSMIESRTSVQTAAQCESQAGASAQIQAGQRVRITEHAVSAPETIIPAQVEDAWQRHQLVAADRPLAEILDELARHRRGFIYYDRPQIEGIRVSAVLPLDAPDQAIKLLQASFPILRVRTLTDYLVLIDAPAPSP